MGKVRPEILQGSIESLGNERTSSAMGYAQEMRKEYDLFIEIFLDLN